MSTGTATGAPARGPAGPAWDELRVEHPADGRVLAATAAAALAADLAFRSGVAVAAGAAGVVVLAAGLLASGRLANPQARALVAAAPLFALWLAGRSSPWLLPLDVLAAAGLLVLGSSLAGGGSVIDLTVPDVVARGLRAFLHGVAAPGFVVAALHRRGAGGRAVAVARGLVLAAPLVLVLGLLLASADAVFASFLRLPLDASTAEHAVLLALGAWGMAGLLRVASAGPGRPLPAAGAGLGGVEALTVLGCLVTLYAAFALAQLVALSGAGRRVLETEGLTYAAYARSGFFQLLAVGALTLCTLLALRAGADAGGAAGQRFVVLAEAAVALTLVIVVVALRRLHLYEQEFGLTVLRLYSALFAGWMGAVFVLLGASLAGVGHRQAWFLPAAVGLGLALVLALDVASPEAVVVRRNVARVAATGRFDADYHARLSDDAVPALVAALPRLDQPARARLLADLCAAPPPPSGWLRFNGSRHGASEARRRVCPPGSPATRPRSSPGPASRPQTATAGRVVNPRVQPSSVSPSTLSRHV